MVRPNSQLTPEQELFIDTQRHLNDDNPLRKIIGLFISMLGYYSKIEGEKRFAGEIVFILNEFCPEQDDGSREVDGTAFNTIRDNLQEFILYVIGQHINISSLITEQDNQE